MKKTIFILFTILLFTASCGKEEVDLDTPISESIESENESTLQEDSSTKENSVETESLEEIPHRTNEEIIGISNKSISDISVSFSDSVLEDVTGNWRLSKIAENIDIAEYALSYYNDYFNADTEIHGVVNFTTKTTTSISKIGDILNVKIYEYVDGEEHSAKLLFGGMLLGEYWIYLDNGDIEKIQ